MNQQEMKQKNKKIIYHSISDAPGISRVNIAKQCKYSKTTVSMLVDELIQEGYVIDGGSAEKAINAQGRKPNSLYLNKDMHCIVLVNWHKRYIQIAQVRLDCKIGNMRTFVPDGNKKDIQDCLVEQIDSYIREECNAFHVICVCMILPAMINEKEDEVISVVLSESHTDHLISNLRKNVSYPLYFFNDTACLAYGEKVFGSGNKKDDFVYININNGIGAAFVLNGKLLGGTSGMSTQFGHFSLGRTEKECICEGHGCLETRVGEQALEERIRECGVQNSFAEYSQVLFRDVGTLASQGDEGALKVIRLLANDLGYALGNLITMLRVDRVVLGGFGCNLGQAFLENVRKDVIGIGFQQFVRKSVIEYTSLDDDALFMGAAKCFFDNYLEFS